MKYFIFTIILIISISANSQNYIPIDSTDPINFHNDYIMYRGDTITLNEKALFVDGSLNKEEVELLPYVFNSFNEAVKNLKAGSEDEPMTIYIAPYVYWIDNPDDEQIRRPLAQQGIPFALTINCPWLKLYGLTQNPANVVLSANRGQSQGADGNFTLIDYVGDGLQLHNITLGNYCNIDLIYPLKTELNRKRRMNAITQAQLLIARGDKNQAHNVHFLSRLNLCPMSGSKRALFNQCYFEMTDDALCESGVYLNCNFTFYGSKPFYSTQPQGGAIFLNCDFNLKTNRYQYFVKSNGPVTVIDSRFHSDHPIYIGWHQEPSLDKRFYQSNVTHNEASIIIDEENPDVTVDITNTPLLNAYKIMHNDEIIYNTYNLLAGNDDWDPMEVKHNIHAAQNNLGIELIKLPTHLSAICNIDTVQAEKIGGTIIAIAKMLGGYNSFTPNLKWEYDPSLFKIDGKNNKKSIYCINDSDTATTTVINIKSDYGLEAAVTLVAEPKMMEAPTFKKNPKIILNRNNELSLQYLLNLQDKTDESNITWYRCTSKNGDNAIPIKVSRLNKAVKNYSLSLNDVGYYIMAEISPKHSKSIEGDKKRVLWEKIIKESDVDNDYDYFTNFIDFPEIQQPLIIPGFWTVDGYKPTDTSYYTEWKADSIQNWHYGKGYDGARNYSGLLQTSKGARLMFTPINREYKDMVVNLSVAPCKQIGQGFGSATGQYMDICIKFDTKTLTGYGLRIIRTTKFHNAVDFYLVKYTKGETRQISEAITGICYLPLCDITVKTKGNRLFAEIKTTAEIRESDNPMLHKTVNLESEMDDASSWGGIAIQHTGSGWANSTLLHTLKATWK